MQRDRTSKFTRHDKRVTLTLARLSATCVEMPELMEVLQKLPSINYDLNQLPQEDLELLYAEFDDGLERKIKNEFEADPEYLEDLIIPDGVCPLCGHRGCRFIFRLQNLQRGEDIKCGSECIITYGISVKGAETAELAKKMLEKAIRKAIKKVKIETWHKEYGFEEGYFSVVYKALERIVYIRPIAFNVLCDARYFRNESLFKLKVFYEKHGWLNTKNRWETWLQIARFVEIYDGEAADLLPAFKPWEPPKKRVKKVVRTPVKRGKAQLELRV